MPPKGFFAFQYSRKHGVEDEILSYAFYTVINQNVNLSENAWKV